MARKPHNYTHFQNLVDELKDQNKNNLASLEKQLEVHAALLYSMRGLLLKGVTTDQVKLRKDKEDRLEGTKEKRKEWNMKSKVAVGSRFSGKGFMSMLGNFLSTALIGIPGGLRRFLPATLGMALLPKLARGIAFLVAGPALITALQAGFDQDTFSGGVTAFIDSFFAPSGGAYTSLAEAAAGGAGKGALLGFGLLGPRGAIIGGVLGGALTGLNHVFQEDKSKMNSKGVYTAVKKHLLSNLTLWAGGLGAFLGAKTFMALGPAGMVAGAILGAGIGIIGSGTIIEMMQIEKAEGADWKSAMTQGLINWFSSEEMKGILAFAPGGGALFGAMVLSKFGPAGMLAGIILGAGAGLLAGPVLAEALRIDKAEGKGMADAYKKALINYFKESKYAQKMVTGGVLGGIAGAWLTAGSIPGILGGMIIGAALGYATQVVIDELDEFFGYTKEKVRVSKKLKKEIDKYGRPVQRDTVTHQTTEIADAISEQTNLNTFMAHGLATLMNWENIKKYMFLADPSADPIVRDESIYGGIGLKNSAIMQRLLEKANVNANNLRLANANAESKELQLATTGNGGGGSNVTIAPANIQNIPTVVTQTNVVENVSLEGTGLIDTGFHPLR